MSAEPLLIYYPSKDLMPDTCSADVSGEQIRRNLTENERGIPLTLDFQVVDAKTCQPLEDVAVDIWGCNTTVSLGRPIPDYGSANCMVLKLTAYDRVSIAVSGPTTGCQITARVMTNP